jgi:pimeloyl-ACP methyl ester carboxylesterase
MNAAEDDVWQAIRLVKGRFKIDEDRQYLTGFSMGFAGALRLAAETPDRWAGLNLASGLRGGPDGLLDNVARLPIMLWAGELDPMAEGARSFAEQCKAKGVTYSLRIAPNLPHTYPYAEYKASVAYLMQFTRPKRPDSFSFAPIAGSAGSASIYGITMRGARRMGMEGASAGSPRFTCQVSGDTVRIESQNTAGLHVVLGEGGLGLSGNVKVVWNGQTAYEGKAGTIDLGE